MAYKVIILYQLYMPSYFLGTFTEYPYDSQTKYLPILPVTVSSMPRSASEYPYYPTYR